MKPLFVLESMAKVRKKALESPGLAAARDSWVYLVWSS